jgi:hypothetical protein
MKPSRKRLVGIAAALSTVAIAAPVSTASAAWTAPTLAPFSFGAVGLPGFPATGWGGGPAASFPAVGAVTGGVVVVGPTVITTAPSSFINTNNQVSAGGNWNAGQFAP